MSKTPVPAFSIALHVDPEVLRGLSGTSLYVGITRGADGAPRAELETESCDQITAAIAHVDGYRPTWEAVKFSWEELLLQPGPVGDIRVTTPDESAEIVVPTYVDEAKPVWALARAEVGRTDA